MSIDIENTKLSNKVGARLVCMPCRPLVCSSVRVPCRRDVMYANLIARTWKMRCTKCDRVVDLHVCRLNLCRTAAVQEPSAKQLSCMK